MFRNKDFNIAFLISIGWHIFCMLCFTIVVLPSSFPMHQVSNVSFLGPILEKTAFELMLERKPQPKRTVYSEVMPLGNVSWSYEARAFDRLRFDMAFLTKKKIDVELSASDLFGGFKYTPSFQEGSVDILKERVRQVLPINKEETNFVIEGPLAKREIMFKPELPVVARRVGTEEETFIVELKFKVSSGGKVKEVALLASSGYPDIDMAAINYIKGLQFSSLSAEDKSIWDKVKLNLKTK